MPEAARFDGLTEAELAGQLDLPRLALYDEVPSTLDIAHELAAGGAPAGTAVLADAQIAGRGRSGKRWTSGRGAGIWLTLIERPSDTAALEVLSLRLGMATAAALDGFADDAVRLKWPNDVYVGRGKVAGILVEARWREARIEWVAIGLGVNVATPSGLPAAGLRPGTRRLDVLRALLPAIRAATLLRGALTPAELETFAARDLALGRTCIEPVPGVVEGIAADGALLVRGRYGDSVRRFHAGSLVLEEAR